MVTAMHDAIHCCSQEATTTMHILPHCGFLAALGVWHENNKITEPQ